MSTVPTLKLGEPGAGEAVASFGGLDGSAISISGCVGSIPFSNATDILKDGKSICSSGRFGALWLAPAITNSINSTAALPWTPICSSQLAAGED